MNMKEIILHHLKCVVSCRCSVKKSRQMAQKSRFDSFTETVCAFLSLPIKRPRKDTKTNPRLSEIYVKLEEMLVKMKQHGYRPDESCISRPLKNHETPEFVLLGHSEKLAVAYNLIQNPPPSHIEVSTNIRMCRDCRRYSKSHRHTNCILLLF